MTLANDGVVFDRLGDTPPEPTIGWGLDQKLVQLETFAWGACGLKTDGSVFCWPGESGSYPDVSPEEVEEYIGDYLWIGALYNARCLLDAQHSLSCDTPDGGTATALVPAPAGQFSTARLSGSDAFPFGCALSLSGEIVCWGEQQDGLDPLLSGLGLLEAPAGTYKAIDVFWNLACAIGEDDSITCWGRDTAGETSPPEGAYKQVSVGWNHVCALRMDDKMVCWGSNEHGQLEVP